VFVGCRGVYKERKPKAIGVIKLNILSEKKYGTQLNPDYWVVLAVKQGLNDAAWKIKTVKKKNLGKEKDNEVSIRNSI